MLHWLFFRHRFWPQVDAQGDRICGNCYCYKEAMGYNCQHMIYNGHLECGEWR